MKGYREGIFILVQKKFNLKKTEEYTTKDRIKKISKLEETNKSKEGLFVILMLFVLPKCLIQITYIWDI